MTATPAAPTITLVQLRCFVAIVDHGSFADAGRHLGLSTSAVSKAISGLERAHSLRLLNRSTHALSLTPEGERLVHLARDALGRFEAVETAMGDVSAGGAAGKVRVSAPTAFLGACLVPLMPSFRAAHPAILLELHGSDAMDDLADEGIDLALRTGRIDGIPGHLRQTLFHFPWVTCASPDYLSGHEVPEKPEDLARHDLIGFRNQRTGLVEPWRYVAPKRIGKEAVRWEPSPVLVLDDANAVRTAGVAGVGVIWAPNWLVAQDLRSGRLVAILADWAGEAMEMSIIRRDQDHPPERMTSVIAFLRRSAQLFG